VTMTEPLPSDPCSCGDRADQHQEQDSADGVRYLGRCRKCPYCDAFTAEYPW
jgi:hypothetical protein